MPLTPSQIQRALTPVRQDRIETKQGLSYVPQQEVRAELTRTYGVGNWDSSIHDVTLVYEEEKVTGQGNSQRPRWVVCYRVACTLRIRDFEGNEVAQFTEYHAEENAPQPNRGEAHALALTSASSYALRRAAIGLGDNMGLHLYNGGSHAPLVRGTLALTDQASPAYVAPQQQGQQPAQEPQAGEESQDTSEVSSARQEGAQPVGDIGSGVTPEQHAENQALVERALTARRARDAAQAAEAAEGEQA